MRLKWTRYKPVKLPAGRPARLVGTQASDLSQLYGGGDKCGGWTRRTHLDDER